MISDKAYELLQYYMSAALKERSKLCIAPVKCFSLLCAVYIHVTHCGLCGASSAAQRIVGQNSQESMLAWPTAKCHLVYLADCIRHTHRLFYGVLNRIELWVLECGAHVVNESGTVKSEMKVLPALNLNQ